MTETSRPPLPPFDEEIARAEVQAAEDAGNSRDSERVAAEFDEHGLVRRREARIDDIAISASDRRIHGPRPAAGHGVEIPIR